MFQRIPHLSVKRALLIALPAVVVALAILLVGRQHPEEPGIRFRFSNVLDYGHVSLDEKEVINLFHLDLSTFQFPADFPLTIEGSTVYLKVPIDTGQLLVPVSFSLSDDCAPSPDLKKLLCATLPGSPVTYDLPKAQQDAASAAWQKYLEDEAEFFVITPGIRQIYPIPWGKCKNCDSFFKTFCHWWSTTRISCLRAYGSGTQGTSLFDLDSHSYINLPHDGDEIIADSPLAKGYVYFEYQFPNTLEVYDLSGAMIYQGRAEDWTVTEDTVAYVGPCGEQSFCAGKLVLDDHGLEDNQKQVLDTSWSPEIYNARIMETRDGYLVTSNGKVYVLSKATLQVRRTFEYPEAKATSNEPQMIPMYEDQDLLVAVSGLSGTKVLAYATAFDVSKCRARLDDSCKVQTWYSVEGQVGSDPSQRGVRHHIYYSHVDRPDLMFSIDQDSSRLAIHDLKNGADYSFELAGLPNLLATSTDGRFLLIRTALDPSAWWAGDDYHLFDLRTMQPDTRELVVGKNLFLISGDTH